ncbi:hypothetical protein BTVI_144118 [Pitangus sulphuratus]|nr:hypothetical protein BTVI_144118 [Pitangus sulphuratus]
MGSRIRWTSSPRILPPKEAELAGTGCHLLVTMGEDRQKLVISASQFGYSNTDLTWVAGPILSTLETVVLDDTEELLLETDTE